MTMVLVALMALAMVSTIYAAYAFARCATAVIVASFRAEQALEWSEIAEVARPWLWRGLTACAVLLVSVLIAVLLAHGA